MRRAELVEQLERLGSAPAPVPDRHRLQLLGDQLQREFVPVPGPAPRRHRDVARHRRRVVLVGAGIAAAAAAFVAVVMVQREPREQIELQAASGAVMLLPGGGTRDLRAGDHIPSGGLIRTGPGGTVTVDGTEIGPDQMVLVEDDRLTLLPAPATEIDVTVPAPLATVASVVTASEPPLTAADVPTDPPPAAPPNEPATAVPTPMAAAPVEPAPVEPAPLPLTVTRQPDGVRLSWTAVDAPDFAEYVVVRGPEATDQREPIARLPDRQITSFTDPSAPADVDLEYRVAALGADGGLLALSSPVSLRVDDAIPADADTDADADSVSTTDGTDDGTTTSSSPPPPTGLTTATTMGPSSTTTTSATTGPTTTAPATTTPVAGPAPATPTTSTAGPPASAAAPPAAAP